jgi:hypothetical protein
VGRIDIQMPLSIFHLRFVTQKIPSGVWTTLRPTSTLHGGGLRYPGAGGAVRGHRSASALQCHRITRHVPVSNVPGIYITAA